MWICRTSERHRPAWFADPSRSPFANETPWDLSMSHDVYLALRMINKGEFCQDLSCLAATRFADDPLLYTTPDRHVKRGTSTQMAQIMSYRRTGSPLSSSPLWRQPARRPRCQTHANPIPIQFELPPLHGPLRDVALGDVVRGDSPGCALQAHRTRCSVVPLPSPACMAGRTSARRS